MFRLYLLDLVEVGVLLHHTLHFEAMHCAVHRRHAATVRDPCSHAAVRATATLPLFVF